MLAEYLPSLTYRKLGNRVRNGLEGWAPDGGSGQVSVCVSQLSPGQHEAWQAAATAEVFKG